MAALAEMKREWHEFKRDRPGARFENQRQRMKAGPKSLMVGQVAFGVLLLAGGVVLLFIPGPGLLLIVFGLALVAGMSRRLAGLLDRAEPPVRRGARWVKKTWTRIPLLGKIGLGLIAAVGAAAFFYAMYRMWFA